MPPSNLQSNAPSEKSSADTGRRRLYWILVIPFIAMLVPQLFNYSEPSIGGVPFFYWYQLLWIPLTSFCTWIVYRR